MRMMSKLLCVAGLISTLASSVALAQSSEETQALKANLRQQQQLQRSLERERAPVKSLQDFYTAQAYQTKGMEAFRKLSAKDQTEFVNSLTFSERGLASFNFKVVEDALTVSEAHDLLSLFGVQYTIKHLKGLRVKSSIDSLIQQKDMGTLACCDENPEGGEKGYRCESRGTCSLSQTSICTDNC